jgi:hypothetical protein
MYSKEGVADTVSDFEPREILEARQCISVSDELSVSMVTEVESVTW